jgi:hypothetical protein
MKKIFIGILYILMLVMQFVYLLIPCIKSPDETVTALNNIMGANSSTGLPVIGLVFIFPAFVFTVLALCNEKAIFNFLRDVFGLFTGIFILASTTVLLARDYKLITGYFVPVIIGVCSLVILILGAKGVFEGIKNDSLKGKQASEV